MQFTQTKNQPLEGAGLKFGLVSVSATATAETSATASEAFSSVAIARLAVKPAISAVIALGGFKRKFRYGHAAFGALEIERRYVMHLSLGSRLIVHLVFA